ncbi:hypothetical protein [Sphingomonas endophytica]|uniref:Uncharacterized protein n=1 Tax=Sphingomonas endophytica TaxID=869719 RepID=A0A147I3I3_9SPHN|nr:hypothetical protein [Sphingomonas endophytica]KTT72606.1 hypothetical protein NS334_08400 [Sphingomonas endophytica]
MSANFRLETLMDLSGRGNAAVVCRCGHAGVIDGKKLWRYFLAHAWDTRLHMAGDHLRCTRCRARQPRIRLTSQKPTTDFGPRDDREWKELVRRLRG